MTPQDLRKPFAPERISWRVGSTTKDKSKGMALAYIDARDVQDRLDEVCGIEGWQCRYVPMHDKKTVCEIGVKVDQEWIWKADGAGDSDVEAEKGALSDAFKRAAVKWGIGRYLYDLESPWVELDTYEKDGKVFAKGIKAAEFTRLRALLAGKTVTPSIATEVNAAHAKAKKWAEASIASIGRMTAAELATWETANQAHIVKLRAIDADLHVKILKAMQERDGLKQAAE